VGKEIRVALAEEEKDVFYDFEKTYVAIIK
jgi:hypothetical protein